MQDETMKDQIVCGEGEKALRRSLLQRRDLTFAKCVDICRASERSSIQAREMTNQEDVHVVKGYWKTKGQKVHKPVLS